MHFTVHTYEYVTYMGRNYWGKYKYNIYKYCNRFFKWNFQFSFFENQAEISVIHILELAKNFKVLISQCWFSKLLGYSDFYVFWLNEKRAHISVGVKKSKALYKYVLQNFLKRFLRIWLFKFKKDLIWHYNFVFKSCQLSIYKKIRYFMLISKPLRKRQQKISYWKDCLTRWICRGRGQFLNFLAMFPGFLASYWSAGFGTLLQVSAFALHWLEDCENFTPTSKDNNQYSAASQSFNQHKIILHLWLAGWTKISS